MCMRRFGQASGEPWCARRVSARIIVSPTEETQLRQAFRISRPQRAESFPSGPAGGLPSGSRPEKAKKAVGYHTTDRRGRSRATLLLGRWGNSLRAVAWKSETPDEVGSPPS